MEKFLEIEPYSATGVEGEYSAQIELCTVAHVGGTDQKPLASDFGRKSQPAGYYAFDRDAFMKPRAAAAGASLSVAACVVSVTHADGLAEEPSSAGLLTGDALCSETGAKSPSSPAMIAMPMRGRSFVAGSWLGRCRGWSAGDQDWPAAGSEENPQAAADRQEGDAGRGIVVYDNDLLIRIDGSDGGHGQSQGDVF